MRRGYRLPGSDLLYTFDIVSCNIMNCTPNIDHTNNNKYVFVGAARTVARHVSGGVVGYGGFDTTRDCPLASGDEPSRRCSDSLDAVLDEIRTSDRLISAESRVNKTCRYSTLTVIYKL